MDVKYIALLISIVSLGLTLYFNHFWKNTSVVIKLLDHDFNALFKPDDITFKYCIANLGNQDVLIKNIELDSIIDYSKDYPFYSLSYPIIDLPSENLIIKMGEIKNLLIELPKEFLNEVDESIEQLVFKFEIITSDMLSYEGFHTVSLKSGKRKNSSLIKIKSNFMSKINWFKVTIICLLTFLVG